MKERSLILSDNHSIQMKEIVSIISDKFSKELHDTVKEVSCGTQEKDALLQCWKEDSQKQHENDIKGFWTDQLNCTTGKKSNQWNLITFRMALAVYSRSPAAYEALKSFKILQLPCVRSLKYCTAEISSTPGEDQEYLLDQSLRYARFCEEQQLKGGKVPMAEGVIIFDEVKVIEKVIWNSKSHEFIGFAMSPDEHPFLNDVFISCQNGLQPAQYILQFLWRDLTSAFDVVGPFFPFSTSLRQHEVLACLNVALRNFENYGFHTVGIVCDGASENLALIKQSMGTKGPFKCSSKPELDVEVQPFFISPYYGSKLKIHWIICPSHQLKNMLSALHSARPEGPRKFSRNGANFGWQELRELKAREDQRVQAGQLRFVPKLLESYIIRDAWTRLNVKPSKIFQLDNVLSELYAHSLGSHSNSARTKECFNYLKAVNCIFENGLLSSKPVRREDLAVLKSIETGFQYFKDWVEELVANNDDPEIKDVTTFLASSKQRFFLSWQTWDLLRISVFGFRFLCEEFLKRHPDYFITPIRITGSAIESWFSQVKYVTGSKLSAVNYGTARKAVLIKSNVQGNNPSNKDYRDSRLYIRETLFQKK